MPSRCGFTLSAQANPPPAEAGGGANLSVPDDRHEIMRFGSVNEVDLGQRHSHLMIAFDGVMRRMAGNEYRDKPPLSRVIRCRRTHRARMCRIRNSALIPAFLGRPE